MRHPYRNVTIVHVGGDNNNNKIHADPGSTKHNIRVFAVTQYVEGNGGEREKGGIENVR